jgi:hypothetical protein
MADRPSMMAPRIGGITVCWNERAVAYLTDMKRLLTFLDGIGSVGALFAAIAAPCCFPLFAGVIAAVGLGALGRSEGFVLYALQGFALLSLFGLALGVRQNDSPWPFVLGVASVVVLAWSFYGKFSQSALYGGLFGLLGRDCLESLVGAFPRSWRA